MRTALLAMHRSYARGRAGATDADHRCRPVRLLLGRRRRRWRRASPASRRGEAAGRQAADAADKPPQPRDKPGSTPESRSAAELALSSDPVFDEDTFQRIKDALLFYSDIQVRGGWPMLPADAKLAPGASGPDVVAAAPASGDLRRHARQPGLRRRLRRRCGRRRQALPASSRPRRHRQPSMRRP